MLRQIYTGIIIALVRPYTVRELPGWGMLYRLLVGDYQRNWLWREQPERWITGKVHGYQMSVRIDSWSNRSAFFLARYYDLPTQLVLKRFLRTGDTMVDIGANEGHITLVAASIVGPSGCVVAFEPNPVPRNVLERTLDRNRITHVELHAAGVGDAEGVLKLFVPNINTGEGTFVFDNQLDGSIVECAVVVGDDILATKTPTLVKIDVEGFELHALNGLKKMIDLFRPIFVIEIVGRHLARDGIGPIDIEEYFERLSYVPRRILLAGRGPAQSLVFEPVGESWTDGDYVWLPDERVDEFVD